MLKSISLDSHKIVRLKTGFRWSRTTVSVTHKNTVYIYEIFSGVFLKFLNTSSISDAPIINDDNTLKKLSSLSFITQSDTDEDSRYYFKLHDLQQRSNSLNYTIAPTLNCNCQCPYCFIQKNTATMSDNDADILASHIRAEHQKTGKKVNITWYGGEPLLSIGTIQRISQSLIKTGVLYTADILTNGLLITDETVRALKDSLVTRVQITLDGHRADHNRLRNVSDAPYDTYSKIISSAERLIECGTELKIRVNCSSENIAGIHNLASCPKLSKLNKSKFVIYFEAIDSNSGVYTKLGLLHELFIKAGYKVLRNLPQKPIAIHSCSALRNSDYSIGPKLELYDCYSDLGNKARVTGVLTQKSSEKSHYNSIELLPAVCTECSILPFCYARGCPYKLAHNNFAHDERFCTELKERIHNTLLKQLTDKYGH